MQAGWTGKSILLTTDPGNENSIIEKKKLNFFSLIKSINSRTKAVIFHEQGTLNYLVALKFYLWLTGRTKIVLVYDIHDIYSYPSTLRDQLVKKRALLTALFERIVFRDKNINLLTVSNGLSSYLYDRYGRSPLVVRSVYSSKITKPIGERSNLIYFGAGIIRFPHQIIPFLGNRLHIDYYDFKNNLLGCEYNFDKIHYKGAYKSTDISFLSNYLALVVGLNDLDDTAASHNLRYSLPNKFFQSLSRCLPLIVYGEFIEAEQFFKEIDGFFYRWSGCGNEFKNIIEKIKVRQFGKSEYDIEMISRFLMKSEHDSKNTFIKILNP